MNLITDHIDLWTSTVKAKSSAGRGAGKKRELYGVKKLRELILDLALRGQLLPQDPSDEPASSLLIKVNQEKDLLIDEGVIKRSKTLPNVSPKDVSFKAPKKWEWVRLGNALTKITDGTHHSPTNSDKGDFLYISAKNIKQEGVKLSNATYVTSKIHEEIYNRCNPVHGDLLYIKDGATTGIVTLNNLNEEFSMLSSVALLKPSIGTFNQFLLYALRSPYFYQQMRAGMTGVAITRVTLKKLNHSILPLPPLAEQHRIVAKVDELMGLCDKLEQQTEDHIETHETLVKTLLDTLTTASNPAQLQQAWQQIESSVDLLFTTESSIDHLKQTILQLAVMGKLVPQNPNDEPASQLLKQIATEKAQLVKEKKIKKQKPFISFDGLDDLKTTIPKEWEWVKLAEIADIVRGGSPRPAGDPRYYGGKIPFLKVGNITHTTRQKINSSLIYCK